MTETNKSEEVIAVEATERSKELIKDIAPHVEFASTCWFQNRDMPIYVTRKDGELVKNKASNSVPNLPASTTSKILSSREQVRNQDPAFKTFRRIFSDEELGFPHTKQNVLFVACFSEDYKGRTLHTAIATGSVGYDKTNIIGTVNFNIVMDDESKRDKLLEHMVSAPNETLSALATELIGVDYEDERHSLKRDKTKHIEVKAKKLLSDSSVVNV